VIAWARRVHLVRPVLVVVLADVVGHCIREQQFIEKQLQTVLMCKLVRYVLQFGDGSDSDRKDLAACSQP
jgi:hypothetical protein